MAYTYYAARVGTEAWLDKDLPLRTSGPQWALSAAGELSGVLGPGYGDGLAEDGRPVIEPWGTLLYAEADGEIRWGGIVVDAAYDGDDLSVTAAGFTTYPHGLGWDDAIEGVYASAFTPVASIWSTIQSRPDGDLRMQVISHGTPPGVGDAAYDKIVPPTKEGEPPAAPEGESEEAKAERLKGYVDETVTVAADPYRFHWADGPGDCGSEINSLCQDAGIEFEERHYWQGESVRHELHLNYPRLGRYRDDITFSEDINIISKITPEANGDDYANEILGIGAGEGELAVRANAGQRDGRLRRARTLVDKGITSADRLRAQVSDELAERMHLLDVTSITVKDDVAAPIGSWNLGDDIEINAYLPSIGDFTLRSRIVGWGMAGENQATLTLMRSDRFTYTAPAKGAAR